MVGHHLDRVIRSAVVNCSAIVAGVWAGPAMLGTATNVNKTGTRKKQIRTNFLALFGRFGINIKDRGAYDSWCDYGKSAADLQSGKSRLTNCMRNSSPGRIRR